MNAPLFCIWSPGIKIIQRPSSNAHNLVPQLGEGKQLGSTLSAKYAPQVGTRGRLRVPVVLLVLFTLGHFKTLPMIDCQPKGSQQRAAYMHHVGACECIVGCFEKESVGQTYFSGTDGCRVECSATHSTTVQAMTDCDGIRISGIMRRFWSIYCYLCCTMA